MSPTNRREVFVGAAAMAAAGALPRPASAGGAIAAEWREAISCWGRRHPNGARTAIRAYETGLALADLTYVGFDGPWLATGSYPLAMFRTEAGHLLVHPERTWVYRSFLPREERLELPPLVPANRRRDSSAT